VTSGSPTGHHDASRRYSMCGWRGSAM
jgi:hypothetical protein